MRFLVIKNEITKEKSSAKFLFYYFERKKRKNSAYSLRALARDLGLSPSYLSALFNGKKAIPTGRMGDFRKVLDLDEAAIHQLKSLLAREVLAGKKLRGFGPAREEKNQLAHYVPVEKSKQSLLSPWYMIPLLDLTTCSNFDPDPLVIAKKLEITESQVKEALEKLESAKLIQKVNGTYKKTYRHMRFPASTSQQDIRVFHAQMIQKAKNCLGKTSQEDYDLRLITGLTVAVNPKNIEAARRKLNECLHDVGALLNKGECTSVFQINVQLFPLTR